MTIQEVARLIENSNNCVVVTGAGISTGAGLPDYRSKGGRWARYDIREVCSTESRYDNLNFIEFWRGMISELQDKAPTKAHEILSSWIDKGIVNALITQNIDGYHGCHKFVTELHGSAYRFLCEECNTEHSGDEYLKSPVCPNCNKGYLRPDVVFFGELIPNLEKMEDILWGSQEGSVLLIIGTSLTVNPLKNTVLHAVGDYTKVIVINQEMPYMLEELDNTVLLQGDIQETMVQLNSLLV